MFGNLSNFDTGLLDQIRRMEREFDDLFGWRYPLAGIRSAAPGSFPPINVGATPEQADVYLFAAGLDPQTLDVSIQKNLLTIAGGRANPHPENARYYRQERFQGDFRRVVALPEDCDPERVEAKYADGVLHIKIGRRGASKPRQIDIKQV